MSEDRKITVSYSALREIILAMCGPSYLIRELQALMGGPSCPITKLIKEMDDDNKRLEGPAHEHFKD